MAEKAPRTTPTPAETSAANAPSDGFFGNAEDLQSRIDEQNAEAYRAQLRDEALAGLDEYLSENPDVSREDALNQIVQDLEAYDKKLAGMDQQGDTYGTLEDTIDKTDAGERLDGIDRLIQSDARLRRMNMMAQDIATLRAGENTPETQQAIQDKEDKLNELLDAYANTDNADETVIDRIIDRTATETGVNTTEDNHDQDTTGSEEGPDDVDDVARAAMGEVDAEGEGSGEDSNEQNAENLKFSQELFEGLRNATDRYAEAIARDRRSTLKRLALSDKSMVGDFIRVTVPGADKLFDKINDKLDGGSAEARKAYDEALYDFMNDIDIRVYEAGGDIEKRSAAQTDWLVNNDLMLEKRIVHHREEQSKDTNKFVNWWVNQKGVKGKLLKAGVVMGAGLAVGVTGGLVLGAGAGAIATTIAGGATGGLIANHVTQRRAKAEIRDEQNMTLAKAQAIEDINKKRQYINETSFYDEETGEYYFDRINNITEQRTNDEVMSNRRRMKMSVAIGALGARLGFSLGETLRSGLESTAEAKSAGAEGSPEATPETGQGGSEAGQGTSDAGAENQASMPELKGETFYSEDGSGLIRELGEFAQVNGQKLTEAESTELYHHLMDKFGQDFIDINGAGADTYLHGSEVRLSSPGYSSWESGVSEAIYDWMNSRGIWHN